MKRCIKIKKIFTVALVMTMLLSSFTTIVQAEDNDLASSQIKLTKSQQKELEEILKPENFKSSIKKLDNSDANQIQISENFILEKELTVEETAVKSAKNLSEISTYATVYETTVTSTYKLKSVVGVTVATLKSVGVFTRDGSTVQCDEADGTVSTSYPGWSGETITSSKSSGSSTYQAWAKSKFKLKYYVGINPVGMELQTVEMYGKVYCKPDGSHSSGWY